jgi:3'-phosphoadenosine 5'-phosphosulfate sulfotransferase (PAPS reductase)/FAD synthetase
VILYSVGKNSSVVLHLARKASIPAACPFLWLHVDTTWKFREMIAFRDETAAVDIGLTELYVQPQTYRPGKRLSDAAPDRSERQTTWLPLASGPWENAPPRVN